MGAVESTSQFQIFLLKYQFSQVIQHSLFHKVDIYRKRQLNYDYIMHIIRYVKKQWAHEIQKEINFLMHQTSNEIFTKLFKININLQGICNNSVGQKGLKICDSNNQDYFKFDILMSYYNYSLHDHIQFKKRNRQSIQLFEYVYVIKSILLAIQIFEGMTMKYLNFQFSLKTIYLTKEGQIKFIPFTFNSFESMIIKKYECGLANCLQDQYNNIKVQNNPESHLQPIKLNKRTLKNKILTKIKTIAQSLFEILRNKRSNSRQHLKLTEDSYRNQYNLHFSIMKSQTIEEILFALNNQDCDYIVIGSQLNHQITQEDQISINSNFSMPSYYESKKKKNVQSNYLFMNQKISSINLMRQAQSSIIYQNG